MPYDRPTLSTLVSRISSDIETRITGATSLLRRSVLKVFARVWAGAIHLVYGFLDYMADQLFAASADSEFLENIGDEFGLSKKSADKSSGITVATGGNGITISEGEELQADDGTLYNTTSDSTIATGTANLAIEAKEGGADGNQDAGTILSFTTPPTSVNNDTTVDSSGISGGTNEETDDSFRQRVLSRKRLPPHGGAEFDYTTWALEVSGVTRAWAFPLYQGVGTIALAFVRDDDLDLIPNATQRQEVYDYIISHEDPGTGDDVGIPVTAEPGFSIIELAGLTVDFEINISPNTSEVQAEVTEQLEDLILRDGGPGNTLYLSNIGEAISLAASETFHVLVSPVADITATSTQVHVLGTITFGSA